jgi:glucosamine--fructose-6-phosphate aminotransferase (isomerizing)
LKEIHEEPLVIENIALTKAETTKDLASLIDKAFGTFMLACGSASYAGIAATYMFSKIAKKHINFVIGSEYKYFQDFITSKTLLIPISQSGESIDVIEPVMKMKEEKGVTVASIVNTLGSTLYRASDFRAMLECGQEKSVAATKSFIAMLSMILLTAYTVADEQAKGQELLRAAAKDIKTILEADSVEKIKAVAQVLREQKHIYIIGRGVSFAGALEATLKIKEAACIHAEAFPGGELKHGVMALIEEGTPCIVFAPSDETYDEIISNAQEVKARGGYIIGIGPRNNKVFDSHLKTADIGDATLLSQVVYSHLLAYYLALACGIEDVDKPRNLAKSVTVK